MASLASVFNKVFKALEQGQEVVIYKTNDFEISFINSGKMNNSTEFKILIKNIKTKQSKMGRFDRLSPQSAINFISDFVKTNRTQDSQSPKLWQIDIQNKKTKRAARTFFCFAENGSEANNKAKKALKMLGEGYELANAPHHIATKGDGQAEQYLKSGIKVIDKAPLSFMDSVVRAFKDSENQKKIAKANI